jgi:hypothetical protein
MHIKTDNMIDNIAEETHLQYISNLPKQLPFDTILFFSNHKVYYKSESYNQQNYEYPNLTFHGCMACTP